MSSRPVYIARHRSVVARLFINTESIRHASTNRESITRRSSVRRSGNKDQRVKKPFGWSTVTAEKVERKHASQYGELDRYNFCSVDVLTGYNKKELFTYLLKVQFKRMVVTGQLVDCQLAN